MGIGFLRPFLRNICCNSPWNYAVFWKLKHQYEIVLDWEDGFCNVETPKVSAANLEDSNEKSIHAFGSYIPSGSPCYYPVGLAVAEMSSTSHVIGKGLVGEVALTGKARWIYAGHISASIFNSDFSEYPDEWLLQFAAGIKTILLFPLLPYGVLQLGSVEMVAEDTALLSQIEDVFVWCEKPGPPDWRYDIRMLSLLFTSSDSYDEPVACITESTPEDQIALRPANESVVEYMLHDSHNKSLENETFCGIVDPRNFFTDHSIPSFIHHEELLNAALEGGSMNLLDDFKLTGSATGEANWMSSFDEISSNFFSFTEEYDPQNEIGTETKNEVNFSVPTLDSVAETKPILKTVCSSFDDSSSCKSCITSLNTSEAKHPSPPLLKEDTWNFSVSEFAAHTSSLSPSVTSVERNGKLQQRKTHGGGKAASRLGRTNKRKDGNGDTQKPRPRDRQLIQDRIKELRELVPNSEKCSIDGLLDRTIKHMFFLRSVTNQANKLKKHEANENEARNAETGNDQEKSASWAVELGGDGQRCPIVVKDLDQPGQMLIEMLCADHDRFLEIANVIHGLQLTVLKGVMDRSSDNSSARFIVETSGSFHRLDIFWPLMQLLQQNRPLISTKI